jgi:hypothetical protein
MPRRRIVGMEVYFCVFVTSIVDGCEWSASLLFALSSGIELQYPWFPEQVWTRWRGEKNPSPFRESNPGRPPRNLFTTLTEHPRLHVATSPESCYIICRRPTVHISFMCRLQVVSRENYVPYRPQNCRCVIIRVKCHSQ